MRYLSAASATRELFSAPGQTRHRAYFLNNVRRYIRPALVLAIELALAVCSYAAAISVVMRSPFPGALFRETVPVLVAFRYAALLWTGLYRRSLRYATVMDLDSIFRSLLGGSIPLAVLAAWRVPLLRHYPQLFLVDACFLLILWCSLHFGARLLRSYRSKDIIRGRRTLIVGAGDAALMVLKEIAVDSTSPLTPVAILDDDPSKWGRQICGLPVRGGTASLASVAAKVRAEEVLVCIPSATRGEMQAIFDACRGASLPVRTLPPLRELLGERPVAEKSAARVSRRDLRPPQIEDLLQREEIQVNSAETAGLIQGQVVLITGAGGTIGAELARQVAAAGPRRLILLDKSENGLFYSHGEACERLGAASVRPFLADLCDRARVRELLRAEQPAIVLHAAAHKHVSMMELHPREAIRNNVLGTRNVAEAAVEFRVARFVNISTDKAVKPRNWMGLSKKLTELCVQELSSLAVTRFSSVRFGNVAGSSGSVLRLFWDRIERGEPIRVTDPRATRFFMSVPEAVHLILRAAAMGRGGETFVLEMGSPVNICDLAKTMMLYSGLQPGRDLEIEFTGLRPGEKMEEELWDERERPVASGSERILAIRTRNPLSHGILAKIGQMERLIEQGDERALLQYLYTVFPDFPGAIEQQAPGPLPVSEPLVARARGAA